MHRKLAECRLEVDKALKLIDQKSEIHKQLDEEDNDMQKRCKLLETLTTGCRAAQHWRNKLAHADAALHHLRQIKESQIPS